MLQIRGSEIPFVRIVIPYISGILLTYPLSVHKPLILAIFIFGLLSLIYLFFISIFYIKLKGYRFKAINSIVFCFFWISLGGMFCSMHNERTRQDHFSNAKYDYLKVRVLSEPQIKKNRVHFHGLVVNGYKNKILKKTSGKLALKILLSELHPLAIKYGDELIICAKINNISKPNHSAEFNYKEWLAAKNIYHQTFLNSREVIKVSNDMGNPVIAFAIKLRAEQVAYYQEVFKTENACAFASTLILGYKSDLDQEITDTYARTGTIHVLSVSGMHVGIVYMVLHQILKFMDRRQWLKVLKTGIILSFLWFYALLTGLSPSVLRSAIMISAFITAKSFSQNSNHYNILAFAAFGLLLYDPFMIWDAGFQLSFLAVWGLIWLQPKIERWWQTENSLLYKIWNSIAMSLAAQFVTSPLSLYYFHQFPVYFLVSNLFIVLPAALLMYTGIAILLFRLSILAPIFEWIFDFTNKGLNFINEIPGAYFSAIWINKTELIVLYLTLFAFGFSTAYYNKRVLLLAFASLLCFQTMLAYDHILSLHQRKAISFKIRNIPVKGFIAKQKVTLIYSIKPDLKAFNYFIKPVLDQNKVKQIKWIIISVK